MNSPHKGQWRGALMFSLICVWINGWANNREAGYLRRCRAHNDVTVMSVEKGVFFRQVSAKRGVFKLGSEQGCTLWSGWRYQCVNNFVGQFRFDYFKFMLNQHFYEKHLQLSSLQLRHMGFIATANLTVFLNVCPLYAATTKNTSKLHIVSPL